MEKLISRFVTASLALMVAAVMLHAHRSGAASFLSPHHEATVVPLLVLSLMPWPILYAYVLIINFMNEVSGVNRIFPRLWMHEFETSRLSIIWEKISAAIVLLTPFAGWVYFWIRFQRGEVWTNTDTKPIGIWQYVSPGYFLDWNAHRYGELAAKEAVSFIPFWQPALMAAGTGLTFVYAIVIAIRLPGRIRASRKRSWQKMP